MDTTNTIAEIRAALLTLGVPFKARDSKATLLALHANAVQAASDGKVQDLGNDDTDCGGCENGECDNCGNYDCCYDAKGFDEAVAEVTGEEATISEWFESKVGTKWTYIYHNGELIAEVRNDSAKKVMAVLQASA